MRFLVSDILINPDTGYGRSLTTVLDAKSGELVSDYPIIPYILLRDPENLDNIKVLVRIEDMVHIFNKGKNIFQPKKHVVYTEYDGYPIWYVSAQYTKNNVDMSLSLGIRRTAAYYEFKEYDLLQDHGYWLAHAENSIINGKMEEFESPFFQVENGYDVVQGLLAAQAIGRLTMRNNPYFNETPNMYYDGNGSVKWPNNEGFTEEGPYEKILQPGERFDRFGSDKGRYASPIGIPIEKRAVAPGTEHAPYHQYEVLKPIKVKAGKAQAWFGDPGGGMQYKFDMTIEQLLKEEIIQIIQ